MKPFEIVVMLIFTFFAGMLAGFFACLYRLPELFNLISAIVEGR